MNQALNRKYFVEEELSSRNQTETSWKNEVNSEAQSCIIQCPSCQTRYSLPTSALAGQNDPRFHCSQCDTIFRVEAENATIAPVITPSPTTLNQSSVKPDYSEPIKSEPYPDTLVSNAFEESIEPQIVPTSSNKAFEIPRTVSTGWSSANWSQSAPHESAPDLLTPPQEVQKQPNLLEPKQMSLGLDSTAKTEKALSPKNDQTLEVQKTSEISSFPRINRRRKNSSDEQKGEVSIQKRQLILQSVKRMRFSLPTGRWLGTMIIAVPLFAFVGALFCFSILLKADPLHSEEILTAIVPGIPRVAPPGLAVVDAHLKKITLDSGDTIYAMTGHVRNNSGKTLNLIHLDGLVFNESGSIITEKRVVVSSPLAQSKIKSLSLEMIEDIEANATKGKTSVKDGDTAPFVVTFQPQEIKGGRFFSSKIHSVR